MNDVTCSSCRGTSLEPGFLVDQPRNPRDLLHWVAGSLQRGVFGDPKLGGRTKHPVQTLRCTSCGHLELFVSQN